MSEEHGEVAAGREPAAVGPMAETDFRLVAALLLLHEQLPAIITEIQGGDFDGGERADFSRVLATIAADVAPPVVDVLKGPEWWYRQRDSSGPPT